MTATSRNVSRRRFLVWGLGGAIGMSVLTACGQSAPAGAPAKDAKPSGAAASGGATPGAQQAAPAKASSKENVNLRFLTTESDPPSQKVYNDALAEFTAANPNIKVEMEYIGFDARTEKIVTGIGAKRAPHITQLVAYEVVEYGRLGLLSSVDDLVTETGGPEKWQPGSLEGTRGTDGKVYAIPYSGGAYRTLWYWKPAFDQAGLQPPKNWDEWKKAAETLTKDGKYGVSLPGGKNRWTMGNYMRFLWQTGETMFDKDFNVTFGKEGAVRAMEMYRDMVKFGPPGFASYSYTESIDAFVSGQAMSQIYAGRTLGRVNDSLPDQVQNARGAKMPAGPVGGDVGPVSWDTYAVFNEKAGVSPAEQEAAKQVLKHMLTGKTATNFALTVPGHLLPPHLDTLKDPNLWEGHPLMKSHKAEIEWMYNTSNSLDYITEAGATITAEKVTPGPVNPHWPAVDSSLVVATMVQKVLVQNESPKSAVEWGATEIKRLVDESKAKQKR
jgi:multiple sugar transport system substrate-binding protein